MDTANLKARAGAWLRSEFDEQTRLETAALLSGDENALREAFGKDLEFGTGGLRGIMGTGTHRMNIYTVGMAAQGMADYMLTTFGERDLAVAIGYDCRKNSALFAQRAADVFAANGIKVFLFESMRPTPEISYAIRLYGCKGGAVITASHNPPEYNGFKAYWEDGAQLVPPHDRNVIDRVKEIKNPGAIKTDHDPDLIIRIGRETDEQYFKAALRDAKPQTESTLKIVYTALHGTGGILIPEALRRVGYKNVFEVAAQAQPDGNFSTVRSPNPEEPDALKMAIELAEVRNADILIGTDPDADRIGVACRNDKGEWVLLNGNQTGCVLFYYILKKWKENGRLNGRQYIAKTVVTTELIAEIAAHFDVDCVDTLTGFKWIAKAIRENEGLREFVIGGEESFGYMIGDFVRDKDAIASTLLACEAAAEAKKEGSSFYGILLDIYEQIAFYQERLISVTRKGIEGAGEIQGMMRRLRETPPPKIAGLQVVLIRDFESLIEKNMTDGTQKSMKFPKSNVLQFELSDGSRFTARPSGTEPKIKFYLSARMPATPRNLIEEHRRALIIHLDKIAEDLSLN
jgi:phosphoglucomutase